MRRRGLVRLKVELGQLLDVFVTVSLSPFQPHVPEYLCLWRRARPDENDPSHATATATVRGVVYGAANNVAPRGMVVPRATRQ